MWWFSTNFSEWMFLIYSFLNLKLINYSIILTKNKSKKKYVLKNLNILVGQRVDPQ